MDYFLSEEQEMIVEIARQITDERIIPQRAELDEKDEFPRAILGEMARADLFGIPIPEEFGGFGGGCLDIVLALEQLGRGCIGVGTAFAASSLGIYPILIAGTQEMREKYLPDVASGKKFAAFGLTEANAGSDASGIQTTAVLDGDEWVLNGTKQWITNGGEAQIYSVVAITDRSKGARGASMLVVEEGDPGFSCGPKEKKMGIRASSTTELIFKDCRIPKDRLIGRKGTGFITVMKTLDSSRPGIAALGLGLAQGALDEAASYAKQRVQFGKPIMAFQAVQHMLADMAIQLEAARALVYGAARHIDAHPNNMSKVSSMCKVFATDMAMKVATDAVQVMGGYGYMREYPVEKMMRDAKILQIYEGTNQIQRNVVGQELNKEYTRA
ncbi:MAG: acyl-CoA dehydrogenase family protein [Proteobacteria bacterium]|nr:acyl-CoA dehydrogenase [Desulfocapsa sp.]MBU3945773.1 acyl-CoA dehydrogenase family protein [Pseudomonadota bacterium]MCG2745419.1 acyl-CoA dehydrogenase family protein [Desulfobacteraceae bacterium]MDO8945844.1 acyl-CoA dehydrogenase family protein [Desulfocapsaceae bacterium]MBU4030065.1 acyl-CoA dehydrogenase family protein [Pseudomonadota bacterium]